MSFPSQQGMLAACQKVPTIDLTITATEGTVGVHLVREVKAQGCRAFFGRKKTPITQKLSLFSRMFSESEVSEGL